MPANQPILVGVDMTGQLVPIGTGTRWFTTLDGKLGYHEIKTVEKGKFSHLHHSLDTIQIKLLTDRLSPTER